VSDKSRLSLKKERIIDLSTCKGKADIFTVMKQTGDLSSLAIKAEEIGKNHQDCYEYSETGARDCQKIK
jgi:hypothetical protein